MSFVNPVIGPSGMDHGDPFVLEYLGTYYLFHSGRDGIQAWTSMDLVTWRHEGLVLEPDLAAAPWAECDYWAPEVVRRDSEFHMYVAATRQRADGTGDDDARRVGLATSAAPLGPYRLASEPLLDHWSIDAHPLRDAEGRWWLFYNVRDERTRFRGVMGCGNVVDELLVSGALAGREREAAFPSATWEGNRPQTWFWNEGAWILERRGTWFQMFSGGFYADETYAVGLATAPAPHGPWTKDPDNPHFTSGSRIRGVGHHCVVLAPDGVTPYACYHAHLDGEASRTIHLERLHWAGDRPQIGSGPGPRTKPTEGVQAQPPAPSIGVPGAWWHTTAWARGGYIELGSLRFDLPAPTDAYRRVTARRSEHTIEVCVDGLRVHVGSAEAAHELNGPDVREQRTALFLEDAAMHALNRGHARSWPVPGPGLVDVTVAVQGGVEVEVGKRHVSAPASGRRRFQLVHVRSDAATEVVVRAMADDTVVTDLVVTTSGSRGRSARAGENGR